jgi:glycosyltransferase involved in cell wall biosynthesis
MRLLLATQSLAGMGGSETYVVTVADHLQRLGHDVWLHALDHGRAADHARSLGLRVVPHDDALPPDPDALVVQDGVVAPLLAVRYPLVPQVFVAHSDIFDLQLPPNLPGLCAAAVTLYDRVDRRVRALAVAPRVLRLSQPIDVERFKPRAPLPARPRVALTFGNYVHGERLGLLRRACERAGIELRHVGSQGPRVTTDPAGTLNDAHIVFGKARAVLEAMACGRAVYVFDHNGAEGWVTAANRARLAADNFGGQSEPIEVDETRLAEDLARYDPAAGLANRDWVVAHHAATKHAAALVQLLEEVAASPREAPLDAPLRELSRLVRIHHRADAQAFQLHAELERRDARIQELQAELQEARAAEHGSRAAEHAARAEAHASHVAALAAEEARAAAVAEALDASRAAAAARERAEALTATARWRAVQAMMAPADRLRAPLRARSARRAQADATADAAPPASPPPPPPARPPALFVVGVARSGTTLLRLQLDAHPLLAIPPETGFGAVAAALRDADRPAFARAVAAHEAWPDLGIDDTTLAAVLQAVDPWSPGDGLRAIYLHYAARHGKPRWGDKTPAHARYMAELVSLLPEARFVHLVRDGRDVAVSLREQPFAPGDGGIEAAATHWRDELLAARAAAARVPHCLEVRYERLVSSPEETLREICAFAELPFHPAMLRAHERAAARLAELPEARPAGDGVATRAARAARHVRTCQPPDPTRAGRWATALTAEEVAVVERVAGDLLAELRYPLTR